MDFLVDDEQQYPFVEGQDNNAQQIESEELCPVCRTPLEGSRYRRIAHIEECSAAQQRRQPALEDEDVRNDNTNVLRGLEEEQQPQHLLRMEQQVVEQIHVAPVPSWSTQWNFLHHKEPASPHLFIFCGSNTSKCASGGGPELE